MTIARFTRRSAAVVALAACTMFAGTASGQLLYGNDGSVNEGIMLLDLATGNSTQFFNTTGIGTGDVYGLATNFDDGVIYWSDNNEVHTVAFDGTLRGSVIVGGALTQLFGGLAWDDANNILYGTNNSNNLYTIDLVSGAATDLGDVTGAGALTGLGWMNGTLFGSDDGANDAFVRIDVGTMPPTATVIPGSDFPMNDSDMDGMAAGAGRLFGVNDNNIGASATNAGGIFDYDLTSGTYGTTHPTAYGDSGLFSGGTYIPEPSALGLLGAIGIGLCRRRPGRA